jgi:hypothetical protein
MADVVGAEPAVPAVANGTADVAQKPDEISEYTKLPRGIYIAVFVSNEA